MSKRFSDEFRCRHSGVNGMEHTCSVGINVRALVGGDDLGWVTRMPCSRFFEPKNGERVECEGFSPYTHDEAKVREAEMNERMAKVLMAVTAAHEHALAQGLGTPTRKHPDLKGGAGELPCPVCLTGKLRYTVAQCNGHMHACCSTAGCARWME